MKMRCSRHNAEWDSSASALCPVCQDDPVGPAHMHPTEQERRDWKEGSPDTPRVNYARNCGTSALSIEAAKLERELAAAGSARVVDIPRPLKPNDTDGPLYRVIRAVAASRVMFPDRDTFTAVGPFKLNLADIDAVIEAMVAWWEAAAADVQSNVPRPTDYERGFRDAKLAASKIVVDETDGDSPFDGTIAMMAYNIDHLTPKADANAAVGRSPTEAMALRGLAGVLRIVCDKVAEENRLLNEPGLSAAVAIAEGALLGVPRLVKSIETESPPVVAFPDQRVLGYLVRLVYKTGVRAVQYQSTPYAPSDEERAKLDAWHCTPLAALDSAPKILIPTDEQIVAFATYVVGLLGFGLQYHARDVVMEYRKRFAAVEQPKVAEHDTELEQRWPNAETPAPGDAHG